MKEFIILNKFDMQALNENKPVTVYMDGRPVILCTDEYFESEEWLEADNE